MEHYDWNEYHENLTAQRQAEARQRAAQQASDATQQTPPAAARAQQADGQAPGAQVEPQQAASQQATSQAADVQPAAPQPAKKSKAEREEEPPSDWSYDSEPTKKSKKQGEHKKRDEAPRQDDEQAQAQPQEQPAVQDQRPAQTPSYAQDQSNTSPQNQASAPNTSDEYGQPSGQAPQQDSSQGQTYDWTEEAKAQDAQQKKKGRKSRIILIVVLVAVAIAAVALIAYFVMGNAGNTSNSESAEAATPADDVAEDLASALDWLTVYDYDDSYDYDDDDEYDYEEEEEETETASYGSIDEFLESYGTFEEVTITGTESETFDLPVPDCIMLVTVTFECADEDGSLFVSTIDDDGATVTYYAANDGSFSSIATNASYYEEGATQMEVQAYGDDVEWTITLSPMSSMEALENGRTYSGSGVYCIDADELSGLSVSYEPEDVDSSSFSLTVISPEDELYEFVCYDESLDNEPYEWSDPVCYVIVECIDDSEWSISW